MKPNVRVGTEKESSIENNLINLVLEHSLNAIIITSQDSTIEYVNQAFERITGYSYNEAVGKKINILKSGETPRETYKDLWDTVLSGRTWRGVLKNRKRDGSTYYAKNVITPIFDDWGNVQRFLAIHEDITDKIIREDSAREERLDPITGLMNRQDFIDRIERILVEMPSGVYGVLVLIDLDTFRLINQDYGFGTGDLVLAKVGAVLRKTVRDTDTFVGYLGGDEFAVFKLFVLAGDGFSHGVAQEAMGEAESLVKELKNAKGGDLPVWCTASAGVVIAPNDGVTPSELLARADIALHVAKEKGGDHVHLYTPEDHKFVRSRLAQLEEIRQSLTEGRFVPYFQPILDIKARKITHFEVLARMIKPDRSISNPVDFVGIAESFNVIHEIDLAIAYKAMLIHTHLFRGDDSPSISLNLSGRDLENESFLGKLQETISESGINPALLVFEITETEAIRDIIRARKFMEHMIGLGVRFSVDDFGIGFGTLRYLKELPIHIVKIDGSFIRGLEDDDRDQVFVRMIADMARYLGIITVAEFVENPITLKLLRVLGVQMAQGYAIGRPAPEPNLAVDVKF